MFSFRKKILNKGSNRKPKLKLREVTFQKTTISKSLDIHIYERGGNKYLVVEDYDKNKNPLSKYNFSRIYKEYIGIAFVDNKRNILKAFYNPEKESLVEKYFKGELFLHQKFIQISLTSEDRLSIAFEGINGLYLTNQNGILITENPYKPRDLEEAVNEEMKEVEKTDIKTIPPYPKSIITVPEGKNESEQSTQSTIPLSTNPQNVPIHRTTELAKKPPQTLEENVSSTEILPSHQFREVSQEEIDAFDKSLQKGAVENKEDEEKDSSFSEYREIEL